MKNNDLSTQYKQEIINLLEYRLKDENHMDLN